MLAEWGVGFGNLVKFREEDLEGSLEEYESVEEGLEEGIGGGRLLAWLSGDFGMADRAVFEQWERFSAVGVRCSCCLDLIMRRRSEICL